MLGLLSFCIIVAVWLANKTVPLAKDDEKRKEAREQGKLYYEHHSGMKRLVKNDHMCTLHSNVLMDNVTKEVVHNYSQDMLDKWANKKLKEQNAPGYFRAEVTNWLGGKEHVLPIENRTIWVDRRNDLPYILYEVHPRTKTSNSKIQYFKCYVSDVEEYPTKFTSEYAYFVILDLDKNERPIECEYHKGIEWNIKIELTKEEFEYWNLSKYRLY